MPLCKFMEDESTRLSVQKLLVSKSKKSRGDLVMSFFQITFYSPLSSVRFGLNQ